MRLAQPFAVSGLILAGFLVGHYAADATPPPIGWTVPATIVDVYDGDTCTAEIRFRVQVRLLDCWAPEVRGAERSRGIVSRDRLRELIDGRDVVLHIPGHTETWRSFTFGRVLGRVYIDDQDVSAILVREGLATKTKQ